MRWKWKQKFAGFMAFCMLLSGSLPAGSQTVYASSAGDAVTVEEVESAETDDAEVVSETEEEDTTVATESEAIVDETTAAETATEAGAETVTEDAAVETEAEASSQDETVAADENTSQETADDAAVETVEEPSTETEGEEELTGVDVDDTVETETDSASNTQSEAEETGCQTDAEAVSDDGESEEVTLVSVELTTYPQTIFYYGLDSHADTSGANFELIYSDGTSVECSMWDSSCYDYGITCVSLTADGDSIVSDEAGKLPVGEYQFVYYINGTEFDTVSYTVNSLDSITDILEAGGTLSGLTGDGSSYSLYSESNGHYIKLQVEEGVTYKLSVNGGGLFTVWDDEFNCINKWGAASVNFTAEYTGIYYLKISCKKDFDLSMSSMLTLVNVEVISNPVTLFYYGLDNGNMGLSGGQFLLTFSDGSSVECTSWDGVWSDYNLSYFKYTADGDNVDDNLQTGEFQFVICGINEEIVEYVSIPYTVVYPESIDLELEVDETLSGLSGDGSYYGYASIERHYLKLQVEEGVTYELTLSSYGLFRLWNEEYGNVADAWGYSFTFTADYTGIYYLKVSCEDDFDLSMTSLLSVTSAELVTSPRTIYYYALDDGFYFPYDMELLLTFEDGSSVECEIWDSYWYEYNMSYNSQTADGNSITYDSEGYQPAGDYLYVIYIYGKEVLRIPYSVLSLDDISLELEADETLSSLSGDGNDYGYTGAGNYLKLQVEEGVTYKLTSTSSGYFRLWSEEDGYVVDTWGTSCGFTATFTGEYYLKVSCYRDFSLSMTSIPTVTGVEVTNSARTTYYYRLDEACYAPYYTEFLLTFEDGSSTECMYEDETWYEYNMSYVSQTADGNSITYDSEGYQPVGDYQYVIYVGGKEYVKIPYTVLSVDEIDLELEAGETLAGLSGDGSNYGWYSDGNYLKIQTEEGKIYKFTTTSYGSFRVWKNEDCNSVYSGYGTSISFTADYTGIYYVRVSCENDFDLTLTAYSSIVGIELVTAPSSILYYGLDYYYNAVRNIELKLYLEDGSSVNCGLYDDTWYLYGLSYTTQTADGDGWSYDSSWKQPVGEYQYVFYTEDYSVTSAFSVVYADEAPIVENGAETVWDSDMPTVYQLIVEEDSTYLISFTSESSMYFRIYDSDLTYISSVYGSDKEWSVELEAGIYYIHLYSFNYPNSATFSVTRINELAAMTYDGGPITFTYGSWGYSVGTTVSGSSSVSGNSSSSSSVSGNSSSSSSVSGNSSSSSSVSGNSSSSSSVSGNSSSSSDSGYESGEQIVGTITTVSGNDISYTYEGFYFSGLTLNLEQTDGSIIEAIYDSAIWWLYDIIQEFFTADGGAVYADESGYVPVGDYQVRFSSGDVSVSIPFSVVGSDLVITSQPESVVVDSEGDTATLTVEAEGDGLTYCWYYKNPGSSVFKNAGIYTASVSVVMIPARDGREMYCVITDAHGNSVTTDTVTLSIRETQESTITIITQPQSVVVENEGDLATVSVVAEGEGLSYSWYYKNPGNSSFSESKIYTASTTVAVTAARNGREMYCVITDAYGNSVTTDTVTLSIKTATITIITQPESVIVEKEGDAATLTVVAEGEDLSYSWYYKNPGSSSFNESRIYTASTTVAVTAARNGREMYCVITDANGNSVTTDTVTLSIKTATITIITQPESVTVDNEGDTATLTVEADGDGISYSWYYKNPGNSVFKEAGIYTASVSVVMLPMRDGREMYCVITDAYGNSVTTDTVTLSIKTATITIITQPESVTVDNEGDAATLTVVAEGEDLSYSWYYKNPGNRSFNESRIYTASTTVVVTAARNGREMYCVITDANGNSVTTDTVTLSIKTAAITIVTQPESVIVEKEGDAATLTVVAEGEDLSYSWYYKNPGNSTFNESRIYTASTTVVMTAARDGREMYCVITDANGNSVTTNTVTLTIQTEAIKIIEQPESVVVEKEGDTATLTVVAVGEGLSYSWYYKNPGNRSFNESRIYTASTTVAVTAARDGREMYCVITDVNGNSVTTDTVTLSIKTVE